MLHDSVLLNSFGGGIYLLHDSVVIKFIWWRYCSVLHDSAIINSFGGGILCFP